MTLSEAAGTTISLRARAGLHAEMAISEAILPAPADGLWKLTPLIGPADRPLEIAGAISTAARKTPPNPQPRFPQLPTAPATTMPPVHSAEEGGGGLARIPKRSPSTEDHHASLRSDY